MIKIKLCESRTAELRSQWLGRKTLKTLDAIAEIKSERDSQVFWVLEENSDFGERKYQTYDEVETDLVIVGFRYRNQ